MLYFKGLFCLLLASLSLPERALQSLIRYHFQLWFHVENDLSKASGVNASEMEQTLETVRRAEAVLYFTTRFWQGKTRKPGIQAAMVTWQLDPRPWGRTPEFRQIAFHWSSRPIESSWSMRWERQNQVSCSIYQDQRKITVFLEISSPVLLKARQHLAGPKGFSDSWKG